nr:hypothetical protein [Tanacetum cinerariifolium]
MAPKKSGISAADIEELITQRVTKALATQDSNRDSRNRQNSDTNNSGGGERTTRIYTYKDFLNYQPFNFKGTEVTIGLAYCHDAVMGTDVESYTQRFLELILLCSRMVLDEQTRCTGGLPDSFPGSVMASKPNMLQEAIELGRSLMAQKVLTYATRQAENKRRMDNNSRSNLDQQPPYKRQNVARAYAAGPGEKREYVGIRPLCNKGKFHHNGSCAAKCTM